MDDRDKIDATRSICGGPIAYTADGVPVFTLYMENIPQQKTKGIIAKYFSIFGKVRSVKIMRRGRNTKKKPITGFVTFEKAQSAAAALSKSNHRGISKRFKVRAADSKRQPPIVYPSTDTDSLDESLDDCREAEKEGTGKKILDLNDDCLLHLFSYLNSLDRLQISLTCYRFTSLYINEHLKKVNLFNFNDMSSLTTIQTRQFLSNFGCHLKRIHLEGPSDVNGRQLQLVSNYCQHLEELDFTLIRNINFKIYRQVFLTAKNLKVLTLESCNINDRIVLLISKLSQLERLNLSCNYDMTGENLNKLRNLIDLNLTHCRNVESKRFIEICRATKLKTLNIEGCWQLDDAAFDVLISTQKDLEQLIMTDWYRASSIGIVGNLMSLIHIRILCRVGAYLGRDVLKEVAKNRKNQLESLEIYNMLVTEDETNRKRILGFRNLKKLSLVFDDHLDDNFLFEIAKSCSQLTEINFTGSSSITSQGIIAIVSTLKQLKYLNVSFCDQFDETLFQQIGRIMQKKDTIPLTICVHATKIKSDILKTDSYKRNKKFLTLVF